MPNIAIADDPFNAKAMLRPFAHAEIRRTVVGAAVSAAQSSILQR
jgi:hypothetical protein